MEYKLLPYINTPSDVKKLSNKQLELLCFEIRDFLINSVSKTGGHLASNLGTVELTVALHKVFDSPNDKLLFDVGHQCYTHKILTGRRDQFDTLRKKGGISGFPKTHESVHDSFISGHSSTSISAALGIANAFLLQDKPNFAVAIIGDGSFTGGLAYEGLNNAGRSKTRLIAIINHNDMSISKNVGAFARYLTSIRARPSYLKLKQFTEKVLNHTPIVGQPIKKWLESSKSFIKRVIYRSTFFEELGFSYLGPIDGHDINEVIRTLSRAKELNKPVVIQIETIKGKGYQFAEDNPGAYHATATFDPEYGSEGAKFNDSYSDTFGKELKQLADTDQHICAITAAMKYGTGLHHFYQSHKKRFFDVGIAEAHAVTFAGGIASQGMIPVFAVYSSFLQRGYDQVIHDLAIDNQHVILGVDRAGIVGEDGETHQGVFDVSFLSSIPNVTVYSPEGYAETIQCLQKAIYQDNGVVCVRYPRGNDKSDHDLPTSTDYSYLKTLSKSLVVTYGRVHTNCYKAAKKQGISVLKLTKISPISKQAIELALEYSKIFFVEEGMELGGVNEHFGALLHKNGYKGEYLVRALDNVFIPQSSIEEAFVTLGFDEDSIENWIK